MNYHIESLTALRQDLQQRVGCHDNAIQCHQSDIDTAKTRYDLGDMTEDFPLVMYWAGRRAQTVELISWIDRLIHAEELNTLDGLLVQEWEK